jgi:transposase
MWRWLVRGTPERQMAMLTTLSPEDLIPSDHPIRRIRVVVDAVLSELDGELTAMYSTVGRPSVPPEQLLKATVLMAMYSIRSERAFCERLNYDLLFKWFLDLPIDAPAFDATTFSKNRQRLLDHEIADRFFAAVVRQAKLRRYVSSDHFSVDGTLLEAWASHKSFQPKRQALGAVGAGPQRRGELPRATPIESDARLDHGPRGPLGTQEQRHRREALLCGASADGAPQRADRRHRIDRSDRLRRT